MLCAKVFTESTLPFWEHMIEIFIHLIVETPFIYLRQIRQDVYGKRVSDITPVFLFKNWNHVCIFWFWGESHIRYRITEVMKNKFRENINVIFNYFYRYITFLRSYFLSRLWISAKALFFVSKLNENCRSLPVMKCFIFLILGWSSHFLIALKTGSVISELAMLLARVSFYI